jgi:hypothetical protein
VAGAFGTSDYSKGTIWSRTAGSTHPSYVGGVAVTLLDGTVFHGYGYSLAAGTINDNGFYWNRTLTSADTVLPGGERQLTFLDEDGGLGVNTVSRNVNFPGASLGSNPLWFYGQVYVTGGESLFAGTRSAWDGTQFYTPSRGPSHGRYGRGLPKALEAGTRGPCPGHSRQPRPGLRRRLLRLRWHGQHVQSRSGHQRALQPR